MQQIGSYGLRQAEPLPHGPKSIFLALEHRDQVQAFLDGSPMMTYGGGLYSLDWAWQELSAERITQFLAQGQVMAQFEANRSLAALATIHPDPEENGMWIGFAEGRPDAITGLATTIRAHAARIGLGRVQVMVADVSWLRDAFQTAGYGCGDWEGELWIFERWLVHRRRAGDLVESEVAPGPVSRADPHSLPPLFPGTRADRGTRVH
jgi:hypothetical protein